jgi:hypothetical protein
MFESNLFQKLKLLNLRDFRECNPHCNRKHEIKAILIMVLITLLFFAYIYSAFISKKLLSKNLMFLEVIRADSYYCYLLPNMILPTVVIIYLNWLSMRIFENN